MLSHPDAEIERETYRKLREKYSIGDEERLQKIFPILEASVARFLGSKFGADPREDPTSRNLICRV